MIPRSLLVLLLMFAPLGAARAHSWYDPRCCNDRDCRRATNVEMLEYGGRRITADTGIVVDVPANFARTYRSQDNDFHVCYYFSWRGEPVARCLYVPGAS